MFGLQCHSLPKETQRDLPKETGGDQRVSDPSLVPAHLSGSPGDAGRAGLAGPQVGGWGGHGPRQVLVVPGLVKKDLDRWLSLLFWAVCWVPEGSLLQAKSSGLCFLLLAWRGAQTSVVLVSAIRAGSQRMLAIGKGAEATSGLGIPGPLPLTTDFPEPHLTDWGRTGTAPSAPQPRWLSVGPDLPTSSSPHSLICSTSRRDGCQSWTSQER